MGIIALLGVLGAGALLAARNDRMVSGAADQFVSEARQTRNYALETHTITYSPGGGNPDCLITPKLWALRIVSPQTLERWYYSDNDCHRGWYNDQSLITQDFKINTSISGGANGLILIYNSPFGKYYQVVSDLPPNYPSQPINITSDVSLFGSVKPSSYDAINNYTVTYQQGGSSVNVRIVGKSGQVSR